MTHPGLARSGALVLLGLLSACGCGSGPASQRGFFCGVATAVTGEDQANAARLETTAATSEQRATQAAVRAREARRAEVQTNRQVETAQRRLASLRQHLGEQREALARLRAQEDPSGTRAAEADRLQAQLSALERDQRAVASRAGGPSNEEMQRFEDRAAALDASLRRFGAI